MSARKRELAQAKDETEIPVIINIYKGAGVTKEEAEAAVAEASRMAKQLGVKLVVTKTNENVTTGDDGSGSGTAEDGKFTNAEAQKVVEAGKKELENSKDKKGLKVVFGLEPLTGTTAPGISLAAPPTRRHR